MLAWLERHQLLLLAAAVAAFALAVAARVVAGHSPPPIEFRPAPALAPGTPIRVHVAGAVLRPGVYALKAGQRAEDALAAAGGPADDADTDGVNLARRLGDEDQVVVPTRGESSPKPSAANRPLDINTATADALNSLPGIGDVYARRIVDSRRVDGAFRSTRELLDRKVLPKATFEKVQGLIVVVP